MTMNHCLNRFLNPFAIPRFAPSATALASMAAILAATPQLAAAQAATAPTAATVCPALLNHTVKTLQDESPMNLCQHTGKVVMVVNTASFCGFVGQYQPLEALYKKYQAKGLVVLGFPSNDFGKQEPGTSKEIADFCVNTYGVQFPMTSKTVVSGTGAHPLYKALAAATKDAPSWNFHKYLIARDGKTVLSYSTLTSPDSARVVKQIEQMLATQ
jgi:glutathione peroxidase